MLNTKQPGLPTISIVVPVYNEADNLTALYDAFRLAWRPLQDRYRYELILVDDGSTDGSIDRIIRLTENDPQVRYLEFSRNFGKEVATTAGLHEAQGDAALLMDADLQHPPELIPEFIRRWEQGAEIVIGVRKSSRHGSLTKRIGSRIFYRMMHLIGNRQMIAHATDFRLMDRCVIDEFNKFTERNRLTRGLVDWLGFRRDTIAFDSPSRLNGEPSYGFIKLTRLAFSSFVSLSLFPLKLAGYLGIIITFCSGALGLFILFNQFVFDHPFRLIFSGPAMLAVFNSFLIGIVLICLGLIALYIANIHAEVINRPMYVVRRRGGEKARRREGEKVRR